MTGQQKHGALCKRGTFFTHFLALLDVDVHTVCIALVEKHARVTFRQIYITEEHIKSEKLHKRDQWFD